MTVFALGERFAQGHDYAVLVDLVFNDPISQFVEGHPVLRDISAAGTSKS
jgi:hypothetical protein